MKVWSIMAQPVAESAHGKKPSPAPAPVSRLEGGVEAVIQKLIPGTNRGGTSETTYFLMRFMRVSGEPHGETQGVRWATLEEAAGLIALTTNEKGRRRDLAVLEAARRVLEHLRS
jgi:hypothetical protein